MILPNANISMTHAEIVRFRKEMERRLRGELTSEERERIERRKMVYESVLKHNDGKNPLFRR